MILPTVAVYMNIIWKYVAIDVFCRYERDGTNSTPALALNNALMQ
jgi:hypothetical protein